MWTGSPSPLPLSSLTFPFDEPLNPLNARFPHVVTASKATSKTPISPLGLGGLGSLGGLGNPLLNNSSPSRGGRPDRRPQPIHVPLAPSAAPTPRCDVGVSPKGYICAPSAGAANDMSRTRNMGRRTRLPTYVPQMMKSASEPSLSTRSPLMVVGASDGFASFSNPGSPKTPRSIRGCVRKVSKVMLLYPDVPSPEGGSPTVLRVASSMPSTRPNTAQSSSPNWSKMSSPNWSTNKKVSFAEECGIEPAAVAEDRSDQGIKDAGLKRSMQLMGSLYNLRRAGWDKTEDTFEEPDEPLMRETLKETEDTAVVLRKTEDTLSGAHDPVHEYGGVRHATAVVSARTLAVVSRKAYLVQTCEDRLAAFEQAQSRRDQILAEVVKNIAPPPPDILGVDKFVRAHVHKGGDPVDANKSDFQSFVSSFGLVRAHQGIIKLEAAASEATNWWAQAALAEAKAGTETAAVSRLLDLAADILGNKEHPSIIHCRALLGDILAENVLKSAKILEEKDTKLVASRKEPQPDSAKNCAELINQEIRTAVAMGAPPKHASLAQAKAMATQFVAEEKNRLAAKVLNLAKQKKQQDEEWAAKCPGVPPVGPATQMADAIEREALLMVEKGVPEEHPVLKEAFAVMKTLRDSDGDRKRLGAREKRLAGK